MGTEKYYEYLKINSGGTVFNIFQQFSTPQPLLVTPENTITRIEKWADGSSLDLIPSCLELSWVLKNPTEKSHLLSQFIDNVVHDYDLIVIDCAPTESILTTAAYLVSQYIFVPVKPEFLATIGLPMFAQSIKNHKRAYPSKEIKMGGVIFNGATRGKKSPEQIKSIGDVKEVAATNNWPVFANMVHNSESYPAGIRSGVPIFDTKQVQKNVTDEFNNVAKEFLKSMEF